MGKPLHHSQQIRNMGQKTIENIWKKKELEWDLWIGDMGKTGTLRDEPENSAQKDTTQAISMLICTRNIM